MSDNLARGLAHSGECELFFCGAENFRMWVMAQKYLRSDPELSRVPLLSYGSPARVYGFLGRWFWELSKEKSVALPARVFRRALADTLRAMESGFEPLDARALRGAQIFHSSFYRLPDSTLEVPGLKRFLSVCDLINIQQPALSSDGGAYLKSILSTLRREDFAIAISHCTKDDLCDYRRDLDPDRISVVHLAASPAFHPVSEEHRLREVRKRHGLGDRPFFLSVCTLDKRKNLEGLVQAFGRWLRQEKDAHTDLVLCGSLGESATAVRNRVREEGIDENRVKVLGYVPDSDLAPLYSAALAFVYPSFYEGFGLPVVEAMQCGLPVVTSRGSSLQEIADGAARLVDPADIDDIAAALDEMSRSAEERRALCAAGLERARRFSWEKSTRDLLAAYRRAL